MSHHRSLRDFCSILCIAAFLQIVTAYPAAANPIQFQTIAVTGQSTAEGDDEFAWFGSHSINNAGQVAFVAETRNPVGREQSNIYLDDGYDLRRVVASYDATPEGDGYFASIDDAGLNLSDAGHVLFHSLLGNTSRGAANDRGAYLYEGSTVSKIMREGDIPPDGNGVFTEAALVYFDQWLLNASGQVALRAEMGSTAAGTKDDTGLYFFDRSSLSTVAREGGPSPGGHYLFSSVGYYHQFALNATGQLAFALHRTDPDGTDRGQGLYLYQQSTTTTVFEKGDVIVDPYWRPFAGCGDPTLDDHGQLAFEVGYGSGFMYNSGLFLHTSSSLTRIVETNEPALDGNGKITSINSTPLLLAGSGRVVFSVELTVQLDRAYRHDGAIYLYDNSSITTILREGDLTPDGRYRFEDVPQLIAANSAGQLLLFAENLADVLTGESACDALFLLGIHGSLVRIVGNGDVIDVDPSDAEDLRTVCEVFCEGPGNDDGKTRCLSDSGTVVFDLYFTDGSSGIFTATIIPEPASLALLTFAVLVMLRRRG